MRAGAARTEAGPVTIESVEVRNDREDGGPGQIQLAAALYDSPPAFRRSVHATNTSGRAWSWTPSTGSGGGSCPVRWAVRRPSESATFRFTPGRTTAPSPLQARL